MNLVQLKINIKSNKKHIQFNYYCTSKFIAQRHNILCLKERVPEQSIFTFHLNSFDVKY